MRWPPLLLFLAASASLGPKPASADSASSGDMPPTVSDVPSPVHAALPDGKAGADRWQPSSLNLSGSIRGGYWSSDRTLDNQENFAPASIWLKATPNFENGWYARAEGWISRQQPLDRSSHQTNAELRVEPREGFVGWRGDAVSFTFGRQIVAWGRADRINPTDVVSTRDYTRLFTDDDDLRRGSVVASAAYTFGDLTATAFWLPEFRPNVYPVPQLANVGVRQGADRFIGDQFAVRLDRIGSGIDWSISYFDGVSRDPGGNIGNLEFKSTSVSRLSVDAVYNRVRMLGADAATNVGDYGLRGEIAYSAPASSRGDIFNPRPFIEAVAGVDRNIGGNWNINIQYVLQYLLSYKNPADEPDPLLASLATRAALVTNQRQRSQNGPALRVSYTTFNDALVFDVMAAAFVSDRSFTIRPRVTYLISDSTKLVVGADIFTGPAASYFGQLRRNTTFLSEVRYAF